MDLTLWLISFPFTFFLLTLSYWKDDKNLNIMGSMSLLIMAGLIITGVQVTSYVPVMQVTTSNVTGNYTATTYAAQTWNFGLFAENIGIALFIAAFSALQYLYFSIVYSMKKDDDQLTGGL